MGKTNIKQKLFNLKNFNKVIFLAIIITAIYYVAGVNDLSIKGFALSELKQQKNKLTGDNNKLELEAMALSSYGKISERVAGLSLVAVGEISYLSDKGGVMAKR